MNLGKLSLRLPKFLDTINYSQHTITTLRPEEFKVWNRDVSMAFMGGSLSVAEVVQRLAKAATGTKP